MASKDPRALAACLVAWAAGEEGVDPQAAAFVIAKAVIGILGVTTKG